MLLALSSEIAYAAWTWTPEVGRWINPRRQPRETAALQFQYAEELLAEGETERAIQEYERVLDYFPLSNYCDLAQYSIGRAYEAIEEYERAVDEYQKVITQYPNTQLFGHVVDKQRRIADRFFDLAVEREERLLPSLGGNYFDKAIDTYRKVIDNQPFTEVAAEAQYKIGVCYMQRELFDEASAEFQKLIDYYPSSDWVVEAAFGTAKCKYRQALPGEYCKADVEDSIEKFQYFLKMYPESERREEAIARIRVLKDVAAEHEYRIGLYYHHSMRFDAARLYFNSIVREYPETRWAKSARDTLAKMP